MNDFITIATYDEYLSANLDKQKLDEHGIDCYLADENTVTIDWILKNAIGGIKLRVPEQQAGQAFRVLSAVTEAIPVDFEIDAQENDVICPNCGSNNTATEKYSKAFLGLTWLVLGFPIVARLKKEHRCFYCDNKWNT